MSRPGRTTRTVAASLAVAVAVAAAPCPARAAPPGAQATAGRSAEQAKREAQAYALFRESEQRYREGEFQQAAELLRRAYALDPEPTLLFNLGRALESAADAEGAVAAYRAYLEAAPNAEDRAQTERRIENLERQLQERRALEAARAEEAAKREALERAVRERQGAVAAEGGALAGRTRTAVPPAEPSARTLPWITVGLGGATAAAGAVLAVVAVQRRDAAIADPVQRSAAALADEAQRFETGAVIGWVAGGALLAGGLGWLLFGDDDAAPRPAVTVGPASLAVRGRF